MQPQKWAAALGLTALPPDPAAVPDGHGSDAELEASLAQGRCPEPAQPRPASRAQGTPFGVGLMHVQWWGMRPSADMSPCLCPLHCAHLLAIRAPQSSPSGHCSHCRCHSGSVACRACSRAWHMLVKRVATPLGLS